MKRISTTKPTAETPGGNKSLPPSRQGNTALNPKDPMRKDCKKFNTCSAPLCPMDPQSLEDGLWYPDEDICSIRENRPEWVEKQRQIVKRASDVTRFFTFAMLNVMNQIRKNVMGADPNDIESETAWLEKRRHAPKNPNEPRLTK